MASAHAASHAAAGAGAAPSPHAPGPGRLLSTGQGWPSVLLLAGLGVPRGDWLAVQQGVARFTQVLRHDRPAPAEGAVVRSALYLVDDLQGLLHEPGLRAGACVLVGHSFGGVLARLYAQRHRKDVAGLVLVDSMHEDQFDLLAPAFPPPAPREPAALRGLRDFVCGGWRDPSRNAEHLDLPASLQALRACEPLGELPLVVVSAGPYTGSRLFAPADGERLQALWGSLQNRLAALSSDVEQVVVEHSGHFVPRSKPQVVVDAVRRLVERLRPAPG